MKFLMRVFSILRDAEDHEKVLENVRSNVTFAGHHLWILACAIIIASIGLNVNSTAVVIGAMLISPLMGPVVGVGFSLATFDFILLKKSTKNLLTATVVSVFFSAFYFLLSPFKEEQSEIVSRTFPTIYDVLIAFAGGIAGAISITRKDKSTVIAGVAIATAIMPPLCAAGFGLAVGNWRFFLGALFLYTINCVFISLATIAIVKLLKFPHIKWLDVNKTKRIRLGISILIFVIVTPSIYFAYTLYQEKKLNQRIENFVQSEFTRNGYVVVYEELKMEDEVNHFEIALLNKNFTEKEIEILRSKFFSVANGKIVLEIKQDNDLNELMKFRNQSSNEILQHQLRIKELELEVELDSKGFDNKHLLEELKVFEPEIIQLSISNHKMDSYENGMANIPVALYQAPNTSKVDEKRLMSWLKLRLPADTIIVSRID